MPQAASVRSVSGEQAALQLRLVFRLEEPKSGRTGENDPSGAVKDRETGAGVAQRFVALRRVERRRRRFRGQDRAINLVFQLGTQIISLCGRRAGPTVRFETRGRR